MLISVKLLAIRITNLIINLINLITSKKKTRKMDPDRDLDACYEHVMKLVDEVGQVMFRFRLI